MKLIGIFITIATLRDLANSTNVFNFKNKPCDRADTFLQYFGISLRECTEECDRHSRCLIIMFMPRLKHCSLKDKGNDDLANGLDTNVAQCMFLEKKDWISSDIGSCNETKCDEREKCVSSHGQKGFTCLKSVCSSPPVIENAILLSDIQTIGSTNKYRCNSGFRSFGTSNITCNSSAEWERQGSFWCEKKCRTPELSYSNAILSRTEYIGPPKYRREIIYYKCGNDYQGLGPTTESICDKNGNWNHSRIRCCPNDTNRVGDQCMFYTGRLKSYDQFTEVCSNKSYVKSSFLPQPSDYILDNQLAPHILWPVKKTEFENNFIRCFENIKNNNLKTYDKKIEFAKDNNMTRGNCSLVSSWALSEPNGGDGENCIMRKANETGYLLYDIRCDNLLKLNVGAFCAWDMPII